MITFLRRLAGPLALAAMLSPAAAQTNPGTGYMAFCKTQMEPALAQAYCQCSFDRIRGLPGIQGSLVFDFVDASAQNTTFDEAFAQRLQAKYNLPQATFQQEFNGALEQMNAIDATCMQVASTAPQTPPGPPTVPPVAQIPQPPVTPPAVPGSAGRDQVYAACMASVATPPDKAAYCACATQQASTTYGEADLLLLADIVRLDTELTQTNQTQIQPAQLTAIAIKNQITVDQVNAKLPQMAQSMTQLDQMCMAQQTAAPQTTQTQVPPMAPPAAPANYSPVQQQFYTACASDPAIGNPDGYCRCQVDRVSAAVTPQDLKIVADIMAYDARLRQQGRTDPTPEEVAQVAQQNGLTVEQFVGRVNAIQPTLNSIDAQCQPLMTAQATPPAGPPVTPPPVTPPPVSPAAPFSGPQLSFYNACTANPEPTLTDAVCRCTTERLSQQATPAELKIVGDMLALDTSVRAQGRTEATQQELQQLASANGMTLEQFAQAFQALSPRMDAVDQACAGAQ